MPRGLSLLAAFAAALALSTTAQAVPRSFSLTPPLDRLSPMALRAAVYRMDANLGRIIDREDPSWITTRGYHGSTSTAGSYGLCQADPGSKMAPYGAAWRTSATVQLRFCEAYAQRYHGTAGGWQHELDYGWW